MEPEVIHLGAGESVNYETKDKGRWIFIPKSPFPPDAIVWIIPAGTFYDAPVEEYWSTPTVDQADLFTLILGADTMSVLGIPTPIRVEIGTRITAPAGSAIFLMVHPYLSVDSVQISAEGSGGEEYYGAARGGNGTVATDAWYYLPPHTKWTFVYQGTNWTYGLIY